MINSMDQKKRSLPQNAALHAMLADISCECQIRGITADKFEKRMFKDGIPITPGMMKEYAKQISQKMFNEPKTSNLNQEQLGELAIAVKDAVFQVFGIYVEFGSEEQLV